MFGRKHLHYWFEMKERNIERWKSVVASMWSDFLIIHWSMLPSLTFCLFLLITNITITAPRKSTVTNTEECVSNMRSVYLHYGNWPQHMQMTIKIKKMNGDLFFFNIHTQIFQNTNIQSGLLIRFPDKLLTRLVIMWASCLLSCCMNGKIISKYRSTEQKNKKQRTHGSITSTSIIVKWDTQLQQIIYFMTNSRI